tara:strand:+ start:446 stop:820 length:375 start_codon:yes stop_codon:yes gene_type:complete
MKKSSEKSFGIIFSVLFFIVGIWQISNFSEIQIWPFILSIIFLALAFLQPNLLKPLNNTWIKLGEILGKLIAPLVMALVFFVVLTPTSLLVRIFGKDLLRLKFSKKDTYWLKRSKNVTTMDKQF